MLLRMQIMIYQKNLFRHLFFFLEIYCRNTILMRYDTMRITRSIKEENYDMIYERGLGVSLYYKLLYLTTMFKNLKKKITTTQKNSCYLDYLRKKRNPSKIHQGQYYRPPY